MTSPIYYFFMKAGFGNQFLQHVNEWGGLWVGNPGKDDEAYLDAALRPDVRQRVRILTYAADRLYVWKVNGERIPLPNKVKNESLWRDRRTYKRFPGGFTKYTDDDNFFSSENFQSVFRTWTLIPVTCEREIPRAGLIAPVDSLAVYQYLNRGTFRPIFRIGGNRSVPHLEKLDISPLPELQGATETELGRFVRFYLDHYVRGVAGVRFTSQLSQLSQNQLQDLIISILNPGQVETVAGLLMLDMGLTPDVGMGKGLDRIDVRGTFRHLGSLQKRSISQSVRGLLEELGVLWSPRLLETLDRNSALAIQCKDYSHAAISEGVLLLKPAHGTVPKQGNDTLILERLFQAVERTPNHFPHLSAWLGVLIHDLTSAETQAQAA